MDTPGAAGPARPNPFLDRLRAGEPTLLLGLRSSRTSEAVRVAHATGHHGIMIDLEHSTMPLDVAAALAATACDLGMTPFVRIPERDYGTIGRLLDCGVLGIVAPRVESVADAEMISRACRFPPCGQRSQLAMVPQYGMRPTPASELNPALDDATIVQILLETPRGIAHADPIAALDGVDMLAIGANDLTAELGVPGQHSHPAVRLAITAAAEACKRHGKLLMVGGISDPAVLATLPALGASPVHLTGFDTDLLYAAAKARAATFTTPT
ncbi:MAG TPA: aldolase/citrate lyase family protein [Pseudonocardia sp.]|nr:aldolase/citrate lyase family protein [Pseudonocardia sp.]